MTKPTLLALAIFITGCGTRATPDAGTADAGEIDAGAADAGPVARTLLHRDAMRIIDAAGRPVALTGVNLGGWLLWEGPVWGGASVGEGDIRSHLSPAILTATELEAFAARVHREYISEADIARIAALGFNVVRVPINHRLLDGDAAEAGWATLDALIGWCEKYGVYAVLDLHAAPGGQSRYFFADPEPITRLWDSVDLQDQTVALWKAIATRYEDRDIVAGYDLLNEPAPPTGAALLALDTRIAAAIREVDTRHLLFIEGADFARDFSMFAAPIDQNMAYSFHMYAFATDTREAELTSHAALAEGQQVPLWCGEFGVDTVDWVRSTSALYDAPQHHVSGRAFWTWKQRPVGTYASLQRITDATPNWQTLMAWSLSGWMSREPTHEEIETGLTEFMAAAALPRCEENPAMAAAIFGR